MQTNKNITTTIKPLSNMEALKLYPIGIQTFQSYFEGKKELIQKH